MFYSDPKQHAAIVLITLLVVLTVTEMLFSYFENRRYYKKRDTLNNIYLTGLAFTLNLAFKGATFFILDYFFQFRIFEIKHWALYWLVLIVSQDFLYWVLHYTGHICRLFWAMHVTHHSSEEFNISTGFRSTVFEPLYRVFFYIPLALMGFSPLDILYAYLITQLYGNLVHTRLDIRLPRWYAYIFVTPSHHRVHHASNLPYLDKNMGMVFIIWDRLFGTFRKEDLDEPTRYGLTRQPEDMGPVNIVFHEWKALFADMKKTGSWLNKLRYMLNPPGWSHDGSTLTARKLQQAMKQEKQKKFSAGLDKVL